MSSLLALNRSVRTSLILRAQRNTARLPIRWLSTSLKDASLAQEFVSFVNRSPSVFHAVDTVTSILAEQGFARVSETSDSDFKNLKPGGRYFFTRNHSTVFAFAVGGAYKPGNGFSIVGAHTDSCCLKVKPVSRKERVGYLSVGVETYGSGLWHTWFDRDLSVAGRVVVTDSSNSKFESKLVSIQRPVLRIPTLAIHLDRTVNEKGFQFNQETHLLPVLATEVRSALEGSNSSVANSAHHQSLLRLLAEELKVPEDRIRDFDLSLFDTQPAAIGGALNEFIYSARIDNLLMCFSAVKSLLKSMDDSSLANDPSIRLITLFDNEEVGSASARGAESDLLSTALERISGSRDALHRAFRQSFLVSADTAHAVHPNYVDKHEDGHRPAMHKGVVLKHNANQRYASNYITEFAMKEIARRHDIPIQQFCARNDMPCGSTIGPILATKCGLRTIDIGVPQLSMHSIRETCSTSDVTHAVNLLTAFFREYASTFGSLIADEHNELK